MQNHWADAPEPDINDPETFDTSLMRFSVAAPINVSCQGGPQDEPPSMVDQSNVKRRVFFIDIHADHIR